MRQILKNINVCLVPRFLVGQAVLFYSSLTSNQTKLTYLILYLEFLTKIGSKTISFSVIKKTTSKTCNKNGIMFIIIFHVFYFSFLY